MIAAPGAPGRATTNFGRVLEDVESADDDAAERFTRPLEVPFDAIATASEAQSDDVGAAWDQALAFVEDTRATSPLDVPPPPDIDLRKGLPTPAGLSDDPQAIGAELGLAGAASLADLQHARRRFMWANHPDRRPDVSPELANRRGAIANMLIDQAEAALAAPVARRARG